MNFEKKATLEKEKSIKELLKLSVSEKDSFIKTHNVFTKKELLELLWVYYNRYVETPNKF